jgi:hypothetical protein
MNQHHDHSGHHHHNHEGHHHEEKPGRQFHKDWRIWLAVVVLLVALGIYVLTNGEVLRPAPPPQPAPSTVPAPVTK